ncbi:MAG: prolyl-tRNA synthetase associated domain-containing protein [Lachnospiraceae bacterium]|nr:prolyl-tRNA synthetase associated domain-containing protein [Lachnospiraceae bacterium]
MEEIVVYHGRPENVEERLSKEVAVYDLLDRLGICYDRIDHEAIFTIEGCNNIDGVLGIHLCKNIFLCNSQKTKFYLLLMPGEKRFVTKDFCKQIVSPRLSFAPAEFMEEYLDITPGSVSVMGLMNDKEHHVQLVIDQDVLKEKYIGFHPCINTSSMRIAMKDLLEKFLPAVEHEYMTVDLPWQE